MSKVAIVTGANQGLGFSLVETLCEQLDSSWTVYLTARNEERGNAAINKLQEQGLSPILHLLDVSKEATVHAFANHIKEQHGGIDILISNAAARISPDTPQSEQVAQFINTNNHGTYRIIQEFMPLLQENARFLVVASSFGSLTHLSPSLHAYFDIATNSLENIEAVMDEYVRLMETGKATDLGWPDWINIPSKIGQVASAKIMARMMNHEASEKGILINAVCPGLVDTAASRPWFDDMSSAQSPKQAAQDVVWLATLPVGAESPYGELIQHRKIIPWQ